MNLSRAAKPVAVAFLLSYIYTPAEAQVLEPQAKLSPHFRMLVSPDPLQNEIARRVLAIAAAGPQRPRPSVNAFILFRGDTTTLRAAFDVLGAAIQTVAGDMATAEIPVDELARVAALPQVLRIEESHQLSHQVDISVPATGANTIWYGGSGPVPGGGVNSRGPMPPPWSGNTGKNALVAVVDSGIDLLHKDFIDSSGKTRIRALWDQTVAGNPPAAPNGFSGFKGNECTSAQIDALRQTGDLITANLFSESMTFFIGLGGGSTGSATISKGHSPASVALADFDLDGNVDMITGNLDGTITWVKNTGSILSPQNPITVAPSNVQVTGIATGDFNHDGIPDAVAVLYTSDQIAVLLGNGNGTFKTPNVINVGTNPTCVGIADFNGDGNMDIVVGNYWDGTLDVLLGDGAGNFTTGPGSPFPVSTQTFDPNRELGQYPSYIAVGDFDGDGKPDLAVACFGRQGAGLPAPDLSILLGKGDGTFGTPTSIDLGHFAMSIAAGDFNGDGILDLAVICYSEQLSILLGNGDGTFGSPSTIDPGGVVGLYSGQQTIALGDLNGDGFLDIAALVNHGSTSTGNFYNQVAVLLGKGDGTFGAPAFTQTDPGANTSYLALGNFHSAICTEVDTDGHGTNVAGIAAANGSAGGPGPFQQPYRYMGMAPEAGLLIVKSTLQNTDLVNAVGYVESKAANLGLPVAINMSVGSGHGPHDGTASLDRMLNALTGPGYIIVSAAGNYADDQFHASGAVGNGQTQSADFTVPANLMGTVDLDLWYPGQDQLGVTVFGPGAAQCNPNPVYAGNGAVQTFTSAACGTVAITANPIDLLNLDHEVDITISNGSSPVPPGVWYVAVTGAGCSINPCVTAGTFDIWATCNPTFPCGKFTTLVTSDETVTSPGSAANIVTVGSYVTKNSWVSWTFSNGELVAENPPLTIGDISTFSGRGPLRDCTLCVSPVQKPDIAAPGEEIMASYAAGTVTSVCGFTSGGCLDPDARHVAYQGTSQATPHVAGGVALLLSQWGPLTPAQVKFDLTAARTDGFTHQVPNADWGFGKFAIDGAILVNSIVVPYVVGFSQTIAATAIQSVGLKVGNITSSASETIAAGSVIGQSPAGGGAQLANGPVNLVVSSGPSLRSIQVTPATSVLPPGMNLRLGATGDFNGTLQDITSQVTWSSDQTSVAAVNALGVVTAGQTGAATLTATLGSMTGSALITVQPVGTCDVSGDGVYTVVDLTQVIRQALGLVPGADVNGDGRVDVRDLQAVLNAVLNLGCPAQ